MPRAAAIIAMAGMACAAPLFGQAQTATRLDASGHSLKASALPIRTVRYGPGSNQSVALSAPRRAAPVPLIVWIDNDDDVVRGVDTIDAQLLPVVLFEEGYGVAVIGHRPSHRVDATETLADIVEAVGKLARESQRLRIDPSRIVIVGKGSGAHFATLLGTDPARLDAACEGLCRIRAVISINGDGFDIARRFTEAPGAVQHRLRRLFGDNPEGWAALSPSPAPRAASVRFRFHAVEGAAEPFGERARETVDMLVAAGIEAEARTLVRARDTAITALGWPQHPETAPLLDFIRQSVDGESGTAAP